jgi:hypothetical protein
VTTRFTRLAVFVLVAALTGAATAHAQSPQTLTLRVDNDAFDFWMMPYNRPDEEYTSGVRITYSGGRAPWWSRFLIGNGGSCVYRAQSCQSSRSELGQDIYTPSASTNNPQPAAGSRANAGWLYLSQTARSLDASRSDELTVTLGVTGPPSLARATQSLFHSIAPYFNRPTDWSRQIRFEPGAIIGYEQRRRLAAFHVGRIGFDLVPSVSVKAGNVETSAGAGVETRIGLNLPHPWLPESVPVSMTLLAGVSGRAVLRDIFLDGNTVSPDYRVGHNVGVGAGEVGVEIRYRALMAAYRVVDETRAYAAGPQWHPWGSLVAGVTFDR